MNAIYTGVASQYWRRVITKLDDENQWKPIYVVADVNEILGIKNQYPNVKTHPVNDAVRGVSSSDFEQYPLKPIDTAILKKFEACQVVAFRMMDRIDALGSLSYRDRVRLFHTLLRYWQTVVEELKPDIVVFSVIPHMVYDYVLYELCKQRGITTIMFESIPVRGLTLVMDAFDSPTATQRFYEELLETRVQNDIVLSEELEAYLQALQGSYKDVPEYVRREYKQKLYRGVRSPSKSFLSKLFDFRNYKQYLDKQVTIIQSKLKPPANYLKQRNKKIEDSDMNWFQYRVFRLQSHLKMRAVIRYYQKLAENPNFDQPYVYVALSYQPERTTSPMGSIYVDQYLMIDLLSKSVPDGWHIYVKEHPTQFTPAMFFRSQSGISTDLYDDINALANVSLVPMEIDSYHLIDGAQAVAAITGTVGWETVLRGKPAFIFGYPWYRGCEGTFHITTQESLLKALDHIRFGYQVDPNKLKIFAYALEKTTINASVEPHLQITKISEEERASILAHAIQEFASQLNIVSE